MSCAHGNTTLAVNAQGEISVETCHDCGATRALIAIAPVRIEPDGTITTLHSDAVAPLVAAAGDAVVARASHVEPDGLRWAVAHADGTDTGKRFDTRAEALAWERENWRDLCGCDEAANRP